MTFSSVETWQDDRGIEVTEGECHAVCYLLGLLADELRGYKAWRKRRPLEEVLQHTYGARERARAIPRSTG